MLEPPSLREQLKHLFSIYPILSPTMMQALLGSKVRPKDWKPVMEDMITDGTLKRVDLSSKNAWGQLRYYARIKLNQPKVVDDNAS